MSKDTVRDGSFLDWLDNQMRASRADPARLCFQIPEAVAASQVNEASKLAGNLRNRGFKFALDAFGSGRDPLGLLNGFPLDFIKIDGAIVQGLASDQDAQAKVRSFVEAADKRKVQTIAERVENANTMAVLWQLGVAFIQGYFINAPEEVVLRAER